MVLWKIVTWNQPQKVIFYQDQFDQLIRVWTKFWFVYQSEYSPF